MSIYFATSNFHKVEEIRAILRDYPIKIEQINAKTEIQSEDVEEVAKTSAFQIAREKAIAVIVEDTGLFIEALNGFPGAYASYVYKTICGNGILNLLEGATNRRATFKSAVAYCSFREQPVSFLGAVSGTISRGKKGLNGFGFDDIFEPDQGAGKTFAEMTINEKNLYSQRAQAIRKFAEWYLYRLKIKIE